MPSELPKVSAVGRITRMTISPPPCKDVPTLISRTYGYVTLHGKKDFAGMIKDLEVRG